MHRRKDFFNKVYNKCFDFLKIKHEHKSMSMAEEFNEEMQGYLQGEMGQIAMAASTAAALDIKEDPSYELPYHYWKRTGKHSINDKLAA